MEQNNKLTKQEIFEHSLKMLQFVDSVCKENDIEYTLHAGTLLGSVRHGGFIPWDDDLDIAMRRTEYRKFVSIFPENERYELQCLQKTPNYAYPYAKIRDKNTLKINSITGCAFDPEEGLDIDLFIIDGYSDNSFIRNLHFRIQDFIFKNCFQKGKDCGYISGRSVVEILKRLYGKVFRPNRVSRWIFAFAGLWKCENTENAGCMIGLYRHKMEFAKSASFLKTVPGKFEGQDYPIPVNSDDVLRSIYGPDYMTPPPVEKRTSTHESYVIWK